MKNTESKWDKNSFNPEKPKKKTVLPKDPIHNFNDWMSFIFNQNKKYARV